MNKMNKMLAIMVAGAVAGVASADITAWNWTGGVVSPTLPAGTIAGGAITVNIDHSPFVFDDGGQLKINIADIQGVIGVANFTVAPLVPFGGTYSTTQVDSDGSAVGNAWLVLDANGGGIEVGDFIGFGNSAVINDLRPGGPGNPTGTPQTFAGGNVTTNVQVIPEPATIGLMGIAGLGMFLARRKTRR